MGKAPFDMSDFSSGDAINLDENVPDDLSAQKPILSSGNSSKNAPEEKPHKSAQEVGRAIIRQQKTARTSAFSKYVTGRISSEMDKRLKLLYVHEDVSRQDAITDALEMFLKHKGY